MFNIPLIGAMAPTPDALPQRKRDWRASLFDRLSPDDTLNLGDSDKSKLSRQALLHAALAMAQPNGGNTFAAIANGLQTGLLSMNQGQDDIANRRYKQQMLANQSALPTEFRAADMTARAAGFEPGTEGYQNFMRIKGGIDPRASNAAIAYKEVIGSDGRRRWVAFDPNEVSATVVGADAGPLAGAVGPEPTFGITNEPSTNRVPAAAGEMMGQAFYDTIGSLIAPFGATVGSTNGGKHNVGSLHYDGGALDIPLGASASSEAKANADQIVASLREQGFNVRDERTRPSGQAVWSGPHLHVEAPRQQAGPNPFVSRAPEEEAAAVKAAEENAKIQAYIANAGAVGQVDAANAALKAGAEANAKAGADRGAAAIEKANALRVYETAVSGLKTALDSTTTGPLAGRLPAVTTGAQTAEGAQAAMAPVLKQLFRTAGEGTFSDSDQKLLISMLPTRMDTPQAAKNKMQNIDAIVRAKLNQPAAPPAASTSEGWSIKVKP